jgi:hypothetical protein
MNVMVTGSQLKEFGIYEEGGVITLGFRFVHDLEIKSLIVQMEESTSELRADGYGIYSEINDKGSYDAVKAVTYSEGATHLVTVTLDPVKNSGVQSLSVQKVCNHR